MACDRSIVQQTSLYRHSTYIHICTTLWGSICEAAWVLEHPVLHTPSITNTRHCVQCCIANTCALVNHPVLHTHSAVSNITNIQLQQTLQHSRATNIAKIPAQTLLCTDATALSSNTQQQHIATTFRCNIPQHLQVQYTNITMAAAVQIITKSQGFKTKGASATKPSPGCNPAFHGYTQPARNFYK